MSVIFFDVCETWMRDGPIAKCSPLAIGLRGVPCFMMDISAVAVGMTIVSPETQFRSSTTFKLLVLDTIRTANSYTRQMEPR